jgi:hypothetical protein
LSTKNLPESTKTKPPYQVYPSTSSSKWATPEDLWQDMRIKETRRRNYGNGQSLLSYLVRNRNTALERGRNHEKRYDMLEDEIEFLMESTGAKSVSNF